MKVQITICDVCGVERGHVGDSVNSMPVQVTVIPPFRHSAGNQMDLCLSCRDRIWKAAMAEVEAIQKEESII